MKIIKTVLIVVCFLAVLTVLPIISIYQADSTENIRDTPLFKRQISDATGEQIEDNDVYYIGQDNTTINNIPLPIGKTSTHNRFITSEGCSLSICTWDIC